MSSGWYSRLCFVRNINISVLATEIIITSHTYIIILYLLFFFLLYNHVYVQLIMWHNLMRSYKLIGAGLMPFDPGYSVRANISGTAGIRRQMIQFLLSDCNKDTLYVFTISKHTNIPNG